MAKFAASSSRSDQTEKSPGRSGNPPVFSVRHRTLKATVWRNITESGPMFNTTVSRSYKDGETWKETASFGFDDVLIVAELLRVCYGFVLEMSKQKENAKG